MELVLPHAWHECKLASMASRENFNLFSFSLSLPPPFFIDIQICCRCCRATLADFEKKGKNLFLAKMLAIRGWRWEFFFANGFFFPTVKRL